MIWVFAAAGGCLAVALGWVVAEFTHPRKPRRKKLPRAQTHDR